MAQEKRIGLISDTHMPDRWKQLPERVFEIFADVDLIIHAGDVGELWVLDQLSAIAPIIAVHGNDEPARTQSALPYLQTVSIAGHRIVISHAHYPNRAEEIASRTSAWQPKFQRRADFAKTFAAGICIFGHTHIPMLQTHDDVLLVNPGAIASGNPWTRQLIQTVAIMTLTPQTTPAITFYDLATGDEHTPFYDAAGFDETAVVYLGTIMEDDILPHREWLWYQLRPLASHRVHDALMTLCHEVWSGERELVTGEELVRRFQSIEMASVDEALRHHEYFGQFM